MQKAAQNGFTLMELLVVIGIIGILAALILTPINRSMQRARQVQCLNNVRQLGQGLQEFVGDNHKYPLYVDARFDTNGVPRGTNVWVETLGNVFGYDHRTKTNFWNRDVWLCPGVRSTGVLKAGFSSYGYNAFGIGADTNSLGLGGMFGARHTIPYPSGIRGSAFFDLKPAVKESLVVHPSNMMAMGDGFYGERDQIYSGLDMLWRNYEPGGFFDTATANSRHQGNANVAFCDGHVESPTLKSLFEDQTDEALARWNRDGQPHRNRL